ncbi:hypothetical protein [Methylorubrum podarium]|jgi:hypothetical protein|uniref:hypothetical protein n=1 Tax=Methylorubrum podarium TaxID=200476 RepID=UPI001EE27443|nr:hypothetical protein [Methylorubrum podarium]GJE73270.1 hypothetical protein CHKEEEPN_4834 [Methylorubrum podarium]
MRFRRLAAFTLSFVSLSAADAFAIEKSITLRNAAGKPCLEVRSTSRPDLVMTGSYHHLVTLENRCSRAIASTVCYKNSNLSCRPVRTRPYSQETVLLGVRSGGAQFDFTFDERFVP